MYKMKINNIKQMTEQEQNLYNFLCSAIPYKVKCLVKVDKKRIKATLYGVDENSIIYVQDGKDYKDDCNIHSIRPYLYSPDDIKNELAKECQHLNGVAFIEWCYAHHIDIRGLINVNLAIKVTESNNPYK